MADLTKKIHLLQISLSLKVDRSGLYRYVKIIGINNQKSDHAAFKHSKVGIIQNRSNLNQSQSK